MFLFSLLTIILSLTTSCLAFPTPEFNPKNGILKSSVIEQLGEPPNGWMRDPAFGVDKKALLVTLRIHLVQQGMEEFHELATKVNLGP